MPSVARLGDSCTGHGDFPSRSNSSASPNVYVNKKAAHRQGDGWSAHCNPIPLCHGSSLAGGSSTVFVNNKPLGRIGDGVGCGGAVASGSSNVYAGG